MTRVRLNDVFGMRVQVDPRFYVDRGGLDQRLAWLLKADRHVVIHGDSKQGKSWLRSRILDPTQTILVQCQPGATPESILTEALGALGVRAEISRRESGALEGTLEISAKASAGMKILAKLGLSGKVGGKATAETATETAPMGQTPGDLNWVAKVLAASEMRLVIEDFHYMAEEERKETAFLLKSLGDYGVFAVVVGVWSHDHLLSYYNGDLEGRIEDIHLRWSNEDLEGVLKLGAEQLGIAFSAGLREDLVSDAYGNVGLLQRMTEALCREEGILEARDDSPFLTIGDALHNSRATVANSMRGRYESFADNFVRGLRRLPNGLEVYRLLLQLITEASDADLEDGLPRDELLGRINDVSATKIRQSDLTGALTRLDRLQTRIGIRPPVLAFSRDTNRLWIVDKSFLFFRKYGTPNWPWLEVDFAVTNDLAATDPLEAD